MKQVVHIVVCEENGSDIRPVMVGVWLDYEKAKEAALAYVPEQWDNDDVEVDMGWEPLRALEESGCVSVMTFGDEDGEYTLTIRTVFVKDLTYLF